jgi:hypothetical protein
MKVFRVYLGKGCGVEIQSLSHLEAPLHKKEMLTKGRARARDKKRSRKAKWFLLPYPSQLCKGSDQLRSQADHLRREITQGIAKHQERQHIYDKSKKEA